MTRPAGGFSLDELTILDIMDLEERLDLGIGEIEDVLSDPKARKGRLMAELAYVVERHTDPDITLEQAAARVKLSDFSPAAESPPLSDAAPTTDE